MALKSHQLNLFQEDPAARLVQPAALPESLKTCSKRLPENVYLGTSSWAFPGWKGIVYDSQSPDGRLAREGLWAYSRHPLLRAAGIDRSYYAPLSAGELSEYVEQVPPDFRFLVKAHEWCTLRRFPLMERYGRRAGQPNPHFLDPAYASHEVVDPCAQALGERAVLLFQFSPQERGDEEGPQLFYERLHSFLTALPKKLLYAVELRSSALFTPQYIELLQEASALHCLNVHPSMPPLARQARMPGVLRGPAVVVRWMLHAKLSYQAARERYSPFNRIVDEDPESRGVIASLCRQATSQDRPILVIANNKAEGSAPLTLFRLAELLGSDAKEPR